MNLLRKLRGFLGVGITWGAAWGAIGGLIGLGIMLVNPAGSVFVNPVLGWALGIGAYGVISGFGFAALLSINDGEKLLGQLSLKRVAVWGVLGAAAVPLAFGAAGSFTAGTTLIDVLGAIGVTGLLGGLSAPASVGIARRAELAEPDPVSLIG